MKEKYERLYRINKLIEIISSCGRHFFRSKTVASIELDSRGRCWFVDDYTGERIYLHSKNNKYKGFSHGGTLKAIVQDFKEYICKGKFLPHHHLGPWPDWYCEGDLWGYGKDMEKVRSAAIKMGIIER